METLNLYIIAALIAGIIFPGFAIYGGSKLIKLLTEQPHKKFEVLLSTAFQLIILMVICLLPFWVEQETLDVIGLGFISNPYWVIGLLSFSFIGWWLFRQLKITPANAQKIIKQNIRIQYILPSNIREYNLMIFVSFVAGICEEIIYRGFLFWFLTNYIPMIPAIILGNLPFALAHLTSTGITNAFKTFVLALIFTGGFLLTKSLWLPILLHILVDLYATNISYKSTQLTDLNKVSNPS